MSDKIELFAVILPSDSVFAARSLSEAMIISGTLTTVWGGLFGGNTNEHYPVMYAYPARWRGTAEGHAQAIIDQPDNFLEWEV